VLKVTVKFGKIYAQKNTHDYGILDNRRFKWSSTKVHAMVSIVTKEKYFFNGVVQY
jgi:hypothetical protein